MKLLEQCFSCQKEFGVKDFIPQYMNTSQNLMLFKCCLETKTDMG